MPAVASSAPDNEPDWAGLRAAAIAVGVREAARQAAKGLPFDEQERFVERVMKRCSREGWLEKAKEARQSLTVQQAKPLSAPVRNGADALSESLADDSRETRLSLSKAARQMARKAESAELDQAGSALQAGKLASLVHQWDKSAGTVRISMFGERGSTIDIEATVIEPEGAGGE